jgi:hypothetical protein
MRRIVSLLALIVAAACGSDGPTGNSSAEGTWNLLTINAAPLPFNLATLPDGSRIEILSESVVLTGGKYTAATSFRTTTAGGQATTASDADSGTYKQNGATLTFTSTSDSSTVTATLSSSRLTISGEGITLIFGKT